ncbi:hypothetical protein ACFVWR_02445 [Leifsonia sp. NPDC058292]|uniref:ParB family protein n=1 Tax=Leifsonia sp. NPDC058292 TaxID=3346428 RepID=UPI0036D84ECE
MQYFARFRVGKTAGTKPAAARKKAAEFRALATTVASTPTAAGRTSITFYLSETLRNRARTAYRMTCADEADLSWSDLIGKALLAEVERREVMYNDGEEFDGSPERLQPGRPVGV